ncbi:MAG: hypothetical protein JWN64_138 [Parcubacteria group bacterium]|nr:hypothetical protein [Parcubacteria group bacterium]
MFVIDVIPLSRSMLAGPLSYRSIKKLAPGSIVEVPLRKQRVRGIVVGSTPVSEAKAMLKRAHFTLAASSVKTSGALPRALVEAALETATYHAAPLGSVMATLFAETLPETLPETFKKGPGFEQIEVERPFLERIQVYRKHLEENPKSAALIVAPSLAEVERLKRLFADIKPIVLSSALTGTKREEAIEKAAHATGLVISTPSFAFVPIAKLSAIILERPSGAGYRTQKRPHLDLSLTLRTLAKARALPLFLGDLPLPLELRTNPRHALKKVTLGEVEMLDVRERADGEQWKAIPPALLEEISKVHGDGGRVAVLTIRRGYAPTVICRDCGTALKDARGNTLSFATENGKKVFRSPDGTVDEKTAILCDVCNSWNLLPLGIGVERVEEELRATFPTASIIRFDADTIRTPAMARKAVLAAKEPGAILVGTEFLLPYLDPSEPLELAAVASADSLLSLPFWRARERFVRLSLTLRERAARTILATRRPEDTALDAILRPESSSFFAEETSLRKALGYPPYATLISFEAEGSQLKLDDAHQAIRAVAPEHALSVLPDRALPNNRFRRMWLYRFPEDMWPNEDIASRISQLPPAVRVRIDPESFW